MCLLPFYLYPHPPQQVHGLVSDKPRGTLKIGDHMLHDNTKIYYALSNHRIYIKKNLPLHSQQLHSWASTLPLPRARTIETVHGIWHTDEQRHPLAHTFPFPFVDSPKQRYEPSTAERVQSQKRRELDRTKGESSISEWVIALRLPCSRVVSTSRISSQSFSFKNQSRECALADSSVPFLFWRKCQSRWLCILSCPSAVLGYRNPHWLHCRLKSSYKCFSAPWYFLYPRISQRTGAGGDRWKKQWIQFKRENWTNRFKSSRVNFTKGMRDACVSTVLPDNAAVVLEENWANRLSILGILSGIEWFWCWCCWGGTCGVAGGG